MRVILSLLVVLFVCAAAFANEDHAANTPQVVRTVQQIDPRLPPALLYHGGKFDVLIEDIRSKDQLVPADAWDHFIVGNQSAWGLPPFRRGFYGTSDLNTAYTFANGAVASGFTPWIAWLHLKESCRNPKKIFYGSEYEMTEASPFYHWLKEKPRPPFQDFSAIRHACFKTEKQKVVFNGSPYFFDEDEIDAGLPPETSCQKLLDAYVNEKHFAIAEDTQVPDSWYIRDETCLERIKGSPEDYLEAMRNPAFFFSPQAIDYYTVDIAGDVLLKSLAAAEILNPSTLEDLKRAFATDPSSQGQEDARPLLWRKARAVLRSAIDCVAKGHKDSFQKHLSQALDDSLDSIRRIPETISCP